MSGRHSSTLSLTSALKGGWVFNATPRPLYPRERQTVPTVQGGWVGPRAGVGGRGKSRHHRDSIPGPSSPQRVIIPTELSWPTSSKCGKGRCSALLRVPSKSEFQLSVSQTKGKDCKSCSGGKLSCCCQILYKL